MAEEGSRSSSAVLSPSARKRGADGGHPPLAWGIFLGTSWTWCIGMFLPVLLVRDLGPWAFAIFALPNVVGAAAMGWVLSRQGSSEAMVTNHRAACVAFSVVTILFHVFFSGWITYLLTGAVAPVLTLLVAAVFWSIGRRRAERDVIVSIAVYLASLFCVALFLTESRPEMPPRALVLPEANMLLVGLAAVCVFGFALCPYLDLTFHRARQATDTDGAKVAFGTGFGAFFFFMILFTFCYTGHLTSVLEGRPIGLVAGILGVHILVQSAFTIAAHGREILPRATDGRDSGWLGLLVVGALVVSGLTAWGTRGTPRSGELPYLLFLAFYGLVFPAYVWEAMLPRSRPNWWVLAAAIVLAAPLYYVGFVRREMLYLIPGVVIVLLARPASHLMSRRPAPAAAS